MTLWVGICRVIQNVQKYFFVDTGNFFRTKFEKWHLAIFESRKLNFLASRASPTEIQQGLKGGRLCQLSTPDLIPSRQVRRRSIFELFGGETNWHNSARSRSKPF